MATARKRVRLVSTGKTAEGKDTGTFVVTFVSKHAEGKLSLRRYDRRTRKHELFVEKKFK